MSDETLPASWATVKLAEVGAWRGGGTPSKANPAFWTNGTIPWVSPKDMKQPRLSTAQDLITESAVESSATNLVSAGSVLLVTRSGILAHSLPIAVNMVPVALNQDIKAVTPHPITDAEFLRLTFQCFERDILNTCRKGGTTVHSIEFPALQDFTIPLPPLAEQKRIVAKIEELFSELEAGEESLRVARRQLGVYRQSLLKQAFEGHLTAKWRTQNPAKLESPAKLLASIQSARQARYEQQLKEWESDGRVGRKPSPPAVVDPLTEDESVFLRDLPDEWRAVPAEAIGDVQLGRQRSPKNLSKDYPTKYIRAANITESGLALDDILEMEFSPQERKTFTLQPGDIVLSEASGSASQVGKPAVWRGEIPNCCFQNTVIRHRLFEREQSVFYLWLYRYFYLHGIFARTAGGVGINHLSAGKFSRLPVPLCSLPEQQEIVRLLDEQFEGIERNEREIDGALRQSEALRQAILHQAFTGRLVPQDPADEPASALLERLRKVREGIAMPVKKRTVCHVRS